MELDHNNIETCKYCDTKLYISGTEIIADRELVPNSGKQYNVKACESSQMRSICPAQERARREREYAEICEKQRDESRRRLNESRAAEPPSIAVEEALNITEPRPMRDLILESMWETMTFPFRFLHWLIENDSDGASEKIRRKRRNNWH
jgi:hypothetical protein